ncbi:MAG TPA: 2-hydroxyacid dehydrogenase [Mycobacteriales bacterium]|nr:2-hydroxyacid dehydrogenase [Mycobacteriales bacterium]
MAGSDPWTMLALPPLERQGIEALFAGLPLDIVVPRERTPAGVLEVCESAEVVFGDWNGALRVTAEVVEHAPRLAFVQQPSSGVDCIDVPACTAAGIPVANSGSANAVSVAEWCLGAALAAMRSLAWGDSEVRAGRWPQFEIPARGGGELFGRRVGIVGMGLIGRECATRFAALGCDVAHWSRTKREPAAAGGAPWMELDELLRRSDVLVIVVALTEQTRGMFGAAQLALLPPGAFVVNAARGGLLSEDALLAAVRSGALAGAALDVYATEPLADGSPLREEDRILLSPHAAAATREAMGRLISSVVDNVRRATAGEAPLEVVNGLPGPIKRRLG